MRLAYFAATYATLLLFLSCNDDVRLIRPSQEESKLVVVGVAYNDLPFYVFIVSAIPELTGFPIYNVADAEITLLEDGIPYVVLVPTTVDDPIAPARGSSPPVVYRTPDPLILNEGSIYTLKAWAPGYDTVRSQHVVYDPVFTVDSIVNQDGYLSESGETYKDIIRSNYYLTVNQSTEGALNVIARPLDAPILRLSPDQSYRRYISGTGSYTAFERTLLRDIVVNSTVINDEIKLFGSFPFQSDHTFLYEFTFFNQDYLDYLEPLIIGNRFEDFNGLSGRISEIPTNIENGYGFFSVAHRERFVVELP